MVRKTAQRSVGCSQARGPLAARIQTAAELELDAIMRLLAAMHSGKNARSDRSARTLANLARALRELAALNRPNEMAPPDEAEDDPIPGNIEEFREALARRIGAV